MVWSYNIATAVAAKAKGTLFREELLLREVVTLSGYCWAGELFALDRFIIAIQFQCFPPSACAASERKLFLAKLQINVCEM